MESDNFCRLSLLSRSAIFNMLCCALQCAVRLNGWFCRLLCSVVVKVECFVIDLICEQFGAQCYIFGVTQHVFWTSAKLEISGVHVTLAIMFFCMSETGK